MHGAIISKARILGPFNSRRVSKTKSKLGGLSVITAKASKSSISGFATNVVYTLILQGRKRPVVRIKLIATRSITSGQQCEYQQQLSSGNSDRNRPLTPPLELACYVIKTNLDDERITLNDIFMGAAPFALTMLVVLVLVVLVPDISLFLVDLLN